MEKKGFAPMESVQRGDRPRVKIGKRAKLVVALIATLLIGGQAAAAMRSASAVTTVRSGISAERTRVVFDLTGAVSYKLFTLKSPDRVVLDLDQASVPHSLQIEGGEGGVVRGLRYASRGADGVRLVLDVAAPVDASGMQLGPNGPYGHRVVVDLREASQLPAQRPVPGAITRPERTPDGLLAEVAAVGTTRPVTADAATSGAVLRPSDESASREWLSAGDNGLRDVEVDISGSIGVELRHFFQSPHLPDQGTTTGSLSFRPEVYWTWDDERQSLLFIPYARLDENDSRRTHFDLRELSYIYAADSWELRAGVRKVFWGVAETNHLVDIINQTDYVENIDLEDKLGQPMVNLALIRDWGTLDLFVLPGFRERTFPGRHGRFNGPLRIVGSDPEYESAAGNKHVDFAVRYSNYFDVFDVGLYHFWGTSREPRFGVKVTPSGEPVLFPIYDIINQTGTDIQATVDNWLWKFEALRREGQGDTFLAAVGGFEYTFVGVYETAMDVGVLGEYHWDERGKGSPWAFNNDIFVGSRLAFNDAFDSQLLGGIMSDLNGGGYFFNVEASRRIGEFWKVELEMRLLLDIDPSDAIYALNRDDYVQVEVLRYF